jgi:hypothetical protein
MWGGLVAFVSTSVIACAAVSAAAAAGSFGLRSVAVRCSVKIGLLGAV